MGRKSECRGWAALCLWLAAAAQAGDRRSFDFVPGGNAASHPEYDDARGFGFEPGHPAQFSVHAAEDNYSVILYFGRAHEQPQVTIQAEQRRFMAEGVEVGRRRDQVIALTVNVRTPRLPPLPENAVGAQSVVLKPREIGSRSWDDKLTVDLGTWPAALRRMEVLPARVPTLYLAGDSTVTDQAQAPGASWGQLITRYFKNDIAVANHADSGESLKSFVTGLRFDKLLSNLRTGDWVMIQFGHNDQKAQWPQTYAEPSTTYRAWLRTYIAEVRRHGATPILVTSPERRNFDADGRIRPTLAEYAEAMRIVAREQAVALLDLNAASVRIYEALGPAIAPSAFADGGNDKTHHNEYGARLLARALIEALRGSDLTLTAGLADHVSADTGVFDASKPPLP